MDWHPIVSTSIKAVRYDETKQTLEIQFHSGGIYRYSRVPKHYYESLMLAPSKGIFYSKFIKNAFECTKIDQAQKSFYL